MEIFTVHARHTVRNYHYLKIPVECRECRVHNASIGINTNQYQSFNVERSEKDLKVGAVKPIQSFLVVDHIISWFQKIGSNLRSGGALQIMGCSSGLSAWTQAVFL